MKNRCLRGLLSLVIIFTLLAAGCSGGRGRQSHKWKGHKNRWRVEKATKIKNPHSKVKLVVNDRVRAWLDYFQGPGRARFSRYLKRSGRYIPLMKKILREHGLPEDVVYIALIESGFTASAHSHANAVGFWQFIGSTAQRFNLRIDPFVDERRCFVKATNAAAEYLTYLYNMFGDWHLAFAAYNSGEGKVQRAIQKYGTKNYWTLTSHRRRHFRAETKDYVPKYIAAALIAKNPRKYGFRVDYHEPLEFDEVKASTQTDFEIIAKASRSEYSEIALLNPHLLMGVTPPGERNYVVRVPEGKGNRFLKAFAKIPKRKRLTRDYSVALASRSNYHIVKRGETASKIARKYGVSTRALLKANKIRNSRRLRRGQRLKIPGRTSGIAYSGRSSSAKYNVASNSSSPPVSTPATRGKLVRYRVRRGDTLYKIATRHNVTVADLKRWNGIRGNRIVVGKKLKIYQGGKKGQVYTPVDTTTTSSVEIAAAETIEVTKTKDVRYKVKAGDTLSKIARKNGVSVKQIKEWNGIKGNTIHPGKSLVVGKKLVTTEVPIEKAYASESASRGSTASSTYYKVRRGDTLGGIARKHGITIAQIKNWNGLKGNSIRAGKSLVVDEKAAEGKARSASTRSDKAVQEKAVAEQFYKVRKGDSWWSVAKKNKMTVAELKNLNPGMGKYLKSGQKIRLAGKPARAPVASSGKTYTVKRGDTLYAIALKTNTSVTQLCQANNISRTSVLRPGMKLKVGGPAAKGRTRKTDASERLVLSSASPPPTNTSETVTYKVKKGDTAWNIAKKHNVSLSQIKGWNTGTDLTKLRPGDVIKLKLASKSQM